MAKVACRSRASFLSMGRILLLVSGLGHFRCILELSFSNHAPDLLDRRRTESKDDDRPDRHSHVVPSWTQSRE